MSTDRWARLRHLFDAVCDLPDGERGARLRQLCDDPALCVEVEALVEAQTARLSGAAGAMGRMLDELVETELREGDTLGAWRLLERMGSGGMGAVFRAERRDGQFEQRAAIKLLRGLPSEHAHTLLARERQILARLEHPGIARLFDGGQTPGGQPYLVMEYIEGESIDRWCANHKLDLRQRLVLMLQVAGALAHAHRQLVLHCDLKPSNVMVREGGPPVLLDFGVARLLDQPGQERHAALTPGYAAPEQLSGDTPSVATDVYGLGRLLAELLVDRRLAGDETRPPLRVSRLARSSLRWRKSLRGDLDLLVARATAVDPGQRYPTVDALAEDLRRYLDRRPLQARGRAAMYRFGLLLRRRAPIVLVACLASVVALLSAWQVLDEGQRARAAESAAREQARNAETITAFLISLFESAHPGQHGGEEPGVRQVLDAGAARLLAVDDLPGATRARLAKTLSEVYGAIGMPDREADLLSVSLAMHIAAGAPAAERVATLSSLIVAESQRLDFERAENLLAEAQRLLSALDGDHVLLAADLANSEGLLRFGQRRLAEAETLYFKALALRRQQLDPGHQAIAAVLHNLGLLELERHRPQAAVAWFEESLAIKAGGIGERHPSYLLSLESLGTAWSSAGNHSRALQLLERAAELRLAIHGELSAGTQRAFNELGAALHDAGRLEDSEHAYQRALSLASRIDGERSFEVAVVMNNLAFCLQDMGRMEEAERLYRRSLELREELLPADDTRVLRLRANLGWMLLADGRSDEARPLLETALERLRDAHPQLLAEHANLELRLAGVALAERRVADAETHLARARALDSPWGGRNREIGTWIAAELALALRHEDAATLAESALTLRRDRLGDRHPGQLPWLFTAIEALRAAGDAQRSGQLLEQAIEVVEATQAPEAPARARLKALRDARASG